MTDEARDPELEQLFATPTPVPDAEPFQRSVMAAADRSKSYRILRRALLALVLSLLAIPGQDLALAVSQLMIVRLVEIESALAAEVLAPVNSVGGMLSVFLFGLRAAHRRLFQ